MRVAAPPTVAARGTVVSITTAPGFQTLFNCLRSAAQPENGTVSTTTSHSAAVVRLSAPAIFAELPIRARNWAAVSAARCASREPITISSPARAQRYAKPAPSGPVPPRIPTFLVIATLLHHRGCSLPLSLVRWLQLLPAQNPNASKRYHRIRRV